MLCKPLFYCSWQSYGLLKLILEYKNGAPHLKNGHGTCITRLHKREVSILNADK